MGRLEVDRRSHIKRQLLGIAAYSRLFFFNNLSNGFDRLDIRHIAIGKISTIVFRPFHIPFPDFSYH